MNKVYKVIWSKAKNCYVVASELAKSHTKAPKSGVMSRALVAGVLACVLSCGAVLPAYADTLPALYDTDTYSSGGSVSATGSSVSSNAFTNVSNSTNLTVNGDISASNFSVVGSPSDHSQHIPAGTGTFVCKADNTNVKTVTVSGLGVGNLSGTITFNERRFASIVDFIHYIDSTSTITSVAPGNTYTVRGTSSLSGDGVHSGTLYSNGVSYNGSPYLGGNGGIITVVYDSSGRIYLGGSTGKAGIVGIQGVDGKAIVPTSDATTGFLVELVNKGDYYETKTLLAPRGAKPGETEGLGTYTRTYAAAGEEISIVGDYSPTLTVSGSSSLSVTGSANLEDGKLSVSNNSSVSTTGTLQASNVQLTDSLVSSGGTLSTKALTATRSTVTANKVETTQGDIDASTSDITATESVESAGVVKAKSLNAPRLLGAGSGMSTLGGGLTVSGQVKGVADATDDTDAVNLGQLNTQLASVAKPYIGITGGELENAYGEGAAGSNSIAFGPGAYASDVSVSIGWKAGTTGGLTGNNGDWTVSIGAASNSTADGGVALGHVATVKAESAVSIGENSTASASGAVAIGSSSVANTANTVSVGSSSLKRKIVNVANGTDANDAATYGQVSSAIKGLSVSGQTITYTKVDGTTGTITTQDANTTYSAGNGVSLSGTTFSVKPYNGITVDSNGIGVKAGTNVTVNSNGVSVTGSGTVASGNTGLISGGTLFTEGRITADGTFAKKANSIATNITALDTAAKNAIKGLSVSGTTITYTKGDGTTGTITTQDNNTTYSAFTGATSSAAGTAGLVKAPAAGDQNKFLRGDGTWVADNNTTYSAGTGLSLSGTTFSVNTNGSIASGNTGVLNGGTVYSEVRPTADGTFAKKANTTAANITALDTAAKNAIKGLSVSGQTITYTKGDGTTGTITTQDNNTTYDNMTASELSTGTATTARSISAKTIADYVTGKVSAETTARTSAVSSEATTRANADTALGTRIDGTIKDLSVSGRTITYTKGDGTTGTITTQDSNTTYDAMSASELSTGTATTARTVTAKVLGDYVTGKVSAETTARTTAINSEATTRANADTALGTRIDNAITAYESADTGLSNRIGSLSADGNYIKKSATNNVSANLTALDTQLKTTATAVGTETTNRTNADTALSNRIGSVASDGIFIKKSATNDVAANLTALDTAAKNAIKGLSVSGQTITYTKGDGTTGTITTQDNNTTYDNMSASELSTGTATTARSISAKTIADYVTGKVSAETTARTTAISSEATTRANADTALGTRIDNVTSAYQTADTGLSNRIGSLTADGNYIKKAGTKNVSENLSLLDAQLKTTTDGLATEVTNRTNAVSSEATARTNADTALGTRIDNVTSAYQSADTGLSNRIGSVASDGTFIKKSATNDVSANLTALDTAAKNAIKGLSVSGTTITYTKGDGTTGTITTQDNNTTYENMTASELNTGTATTARSISAKVLSDYVNSRIGDSTVSTGSTGSTAVGDSSVVTGNNSVSVGDNSSVTGAGSVSVGTGSTVEGDSNVSIGNNGSVTGSNSVAIGSGSNTNESDTVAIGAGSSSSAEGAVSLGSGTSATGTNSTAVGNNSYSANDNSVALGSDAVAGVSNVVSVGHKAGDTDAEGNVYTTNEYRRIINVANGVDANDVATVGQMNTAVNMETSARTAADTALGTRIDGTIKGLSVNGRTITYTKGDGTTGTIITQDTTYFAGSGLSLSNGAFSVVTDGQVSQGNTGIVTGNTVYEALEARIGQITVENNAQNTVAVGDNSSVSGDGAIAVGSGSSGSGEGSVAVGDTSNSSGDGSVAVGSNSKAESDNTVVIGTGSTVLGTDSDNSVAIGQQTNVTGSDSVAVGGGSSVTGTDSTALGGNTVVNNDNSVALGSGSNASQDNVVSVGHSATDIDASGTAYGSDLTRRIVNVADGSSASDAATVGQTYVIQNGTNTTVTEAGTNSIGQKIYQMTVTTDGQVTSGNTGIVTGGTVYDALEARIGQITVENNAQNTVAVGDGSSVSGDGAIAVGTGSSGSGEGSVAVGGTSTSSGEGSVAVGDTSTSTGEGSVAVGSNTTAESDNTVVIGTGSTVTGTDSNNSVAIGQQTNVSGSDSVALGGGSSVTGTESTAVGGNTVVNNSSSVALGYDSNASNDNVVSVGHKATDTDSEGNAYGNDLTRRIINVADGVDAHDVVTVGQMNQQLATINNYNTTLDARIGTLASDGNYIRSSAINDVAANLMALDTQLKATDVSSLKYDGADHSLVTMGGTSGTKLTNLKQAALSATSTDAVTGAQLYATNQNISGFANDITQNRNSIREVNSSLSAVLDSVSSYGLYLDTFSNLKADASLNNLTAAGQQVIATAAANAVQEYMASQSATNSTNNAAPPAAPKLMASGGMRLMSVNPAPTDTNYVVYDDTSGSVVTLEGQPGTGTKITNLADGELAAASTDAVTGSQLYAVTQQFDEFQSALSRNNTSIARAQTDINNIKTMNLGLQSDVNTLKTQMEAGINVTVDGASVKTINPESNYVNFVTGDNMVISNDNGSVKLSAKSDGVVTNGNTGLVSGGTVYNAIQDALAGSAGGTSQALAGKANADASNIGKNAQTDNSTAWGQALGTGTVSANDDKLVTGNTVYNETRVASDSNYIKKDVSAAANLQNLDTAVKTNADAIAAHSDMLVSHDNAIRDNTNAIQQLQDGVASTASDIEGLKDLSNLTDAGKSVIRNLAQNSTDIRSSDGSLTTTVTADNGKIVYDLSVVKDGRVEEGNSGILTGDTVYQAIKDINPYGDNVITGTDSGAVGKRNTVAGNGSYAIGNDNTIAEGSDDIFILGSNVNATGKNSIVLGKGSDGSQDNVISVGSDGHERRIIHVADGSVTKNSKDAVNGGQLYDVREDLRHANGVDVDDWSRKLGVGTVAEGDTGLVNGGTVYNALQHFTGSDAVTVDREYGALRVGASPKYDDLPFVDFSNSQGAPRVLTGIATNIKDPSSAANVGYVNAVGEMVMQSVNGSLEHTNRRIDKVGAGAAAMSALTPASFEGDEKWSLAASVGNYRSATAGAVGAFYKPVENVMMNVRGSFGNDENMVAAGVAVSLNKGDVPGVTKRQLAKTVNAQAQEIQSLKDSHQVTLVQMQEMRQSYQSRFDEMSQQMNEMAETIKQLKAKTNG